VRHHRPSRFAFVSAVAMVAALVAAGPVGAASLPDLVTSGPSTTAGIVVRGHPFSVGTIVRNLGPGAAAASTLRFYLSSDKVRGAGDKRLAQVRQVGRLAAHATSTAITKLTPAVTTPSGPFYVIACADDLKAVAEKVESNNCAASSHAVAIVPGSTTEDLIDKDLALHVLTPDQAMIDKVFAAFGDSRLPAKYHGDDGSVVDSGGAIAAAAESFDTASAQTKALLIPFLKPPAYAHTWENLPSAPTPPRPEAPFAGPLPSFGRADPVPHPSTLDEPGWSYYQHPKHVRIWFRTNDLHQNALAHFLYFSIDPVWNLTTLMGKTPGSDLGPHPFVDNNNTPQDWGDGGSGDLDIYLADIRKPVTQAYPPKCTDTPSFIVISSAIQADLSRTIPVLAHEFMHVLQFRFHYANACGEYHNLDEATANWAIHYVTPTNDFEHVDDAFLPHPGAQLPRQAYDGWPFELFLQQVQGPGAIPAIYTHTESEGPWQAVNDAVVGGLDKQWPDFAVKAWNQVPVKPSFKEWDRLPDLPLTDLTDAPLEPKNITLGTARTKTVTETIAVQALARQYDVYTFGNDVVKIVYRNALAGQSHAGVHALLQLTNGTWKTPQDWTDEQSVEFCRNKPAEDVKKLVVIATDSTFDSLSHVAQGSSKIIASSDCLPETYDGTFSGTAEVGAGMKMFWSGTAHFERSTGAEAAACQGTGYICWTVKSGTVNWHVGTYPNEGNCTYTSDPTDSPVNFGNLEVEASKGQDGVQTYIGGLGAQGAFADVTIQCGSDDPATVPVGLLDCCVTFGPGLPAVQQDGWLLAGTLSNTGGGDNIHEDWSFQGTA